MENIEGFKAQMCAAWGFRESAKNANVILNDRQGDWALYLPAAVVNTTFCLELLIKSILLLEKKKQRGHHLVKLFRNMSSHSRKEIDSLLIEKRNGKNPYVGLGHSYVKMVKNQSIKIVLDNFPKNLEDLITSCDDLFVKFRYLDDASLEVQYNFENEVLIDLLDVLFLYISKQASSVGIDVHK